MFYCRNEELRKLNKRYNDGDFECVVIYGRRRDPSPVAWTRQTKGILSF